MLTQGQNVDRLSAELKQVSHKEQNNLIVFMFDP